MEDAAAMLPDDVVLEIFVHVKDAPAALFRCAMACKHWRGLIGDLSFLRRCWPDNSFVGFFTRERLDEKDTKGLVPAPGSALGRGLRALSSFVPALPAGAVPLVSRHGLLLVRLDSTPLVVQLAVCNLHVGTCDVLPPLSSRYLGTYQLEVNCYAVLSAADCRSDEHDDKGRHSSSFFKVIIISHHKVDYRYHLRTLSSHETSWNVRPDCFETTAVDYRTIGSFSDVAVRRGTARWFFGNWLDQRFYVAKLDTRTEQVSLTKLSSPLSSVAGEYYDMNRHCLVLADGEALSLLSIKENGPLVEIWGQQGGQQNLCATSEWHCIRTIKLEQPRKETQKRELRLLGEKCGTLLVTDSSNRVYTADLETGTMEMVLDWPHGRHVHGGVVGLEMDWVAVFVSRLGTRYNSV
jgi:hypothetical protein